MEEHHWNHMIMIETLSKFNAYLGLSTLLDSTDGYVPILEPT
jgi:hypothetical protein